jgi:hypothetical protein
MKCAKELGGLKTFGLMTVRPFTERLLDVAAISNACSWPPAILAQAFLQFFIVSTRSLEKTGILLRKMTWGGSRTKGCDLLSFVR